MPKPDRILIVCLGNICRSPTAEAVLRDRLGRAGIAAEVDSAGTGDWHIGDPPHDGTIAAASRAGYDLSALRARQIVPEDFERFDLILAADPSNLRDLERIRPAGNTTRAELFAPYAGRGVDTIPDPYHSGDFDGALDLIEAASEGWFVAQLQ